MTATVQKGYKGMGMEGSVARWYDKTTRKDMPEFRKLAERLRAVLPDGSDVLELAPGPGFLSIEMAKGGKLRVIGLDISKTFVGLARRNAAEAGVKVNFIEGNASAMTFVDSSFDFLVCRAAFKNFSQPQKAFQEMYRVLRPGGTALVIDLLRDTPMSAISAYVDNIGVGLVNRIMMKSTFRHVLLKRAYTTQEFTQMLAKIPFRKTEMRQVPGGVGIEIWCSK